MLAFGVAWRPAGAALVQVAGDKPGFGHGVCSQLNLSNDSAHADVGGALNERETDRIEHSPAGMKQVLNLKVAPEPNEPGHRSNQNGAGVFDHDGARGASELN